MLIQWDPASAPDSLKMLVGEPGFSAKGLQRRLARSIKTDRDLTLFLLNGRHRDKSSSYSTYNRRTKKKD